MERQIKSRKFRFAIAKEEVIKHQNMKLAGLQRSETGSLHHRPHQQGGQVEWHRDRNTPEAVVPMAPAVPGSYEEDTDCSDARLIIQSVILNSPSLHGPVQPMFCFILPNSEN